MIIDDASADFVTTGPCTWNTSSGDNSAYNQVYHRILSDISGSCTATWFIQPDAFTPAGEYDVFAHIPNDDAASLGVEYTIQHNGQTSVAVIVQAAYLANNTEHDAWAYLGRYDFAMEPFLGEYIRLDSQTVVSDTNTYVLADAIMLAPALTEAGAEFPPPPVEEVYVSFAGDGMAGGVPYADEDILVYNAVTAEWSLLFDGSDVGLKDKNLDDFDFRNANIYYSLNQPRVSIGIVPQVYRFSPTSLGADTAGTITNFFTNSELTTAAEDVDAFSFGPDGRYLFSTVGTAVTSGGSFDDEDVFAYSPRSIGLKNFALFWDGKAAGLTKDSEDVNGLWLDQAADRLHLTTVGSFDIPGSSGDGADIFSCKRKTEDGGINCGPGLFWNGSAHGLG